MNVEKVNELFLTREWRGEEVFYCHWSGAAFPNKWSNYSNSWLDIPVPVPAAAKSVLLFGMFVGGVLPNKTSFMMHLDFNDPVPTEVLPNGGDWSKTGGQGDFYCDFQTPGVRQAFGAIWVPVWGQHIKLRWKIEPGAGYVDGAWGINIWCQGFAT